MKKPSSVVLDSVDMSPIIKNIPTTDTNLKYIGMKAGMEHYRLLVWLSTKVKGEIIELGTFRGHSALCLGQRNRKVRSFDIENHLSINTTPENVSFEIDTDGHLEITDKTKLVFLDTMHDGEYERIVLDHLRKINWKGILVMDDIVLFPELAKLWKEIPERKEDWTDIGHHSGTGIVYFE